MARPGGAALSARVVIFCFGGRRANMALQLPLIRRILDRHPEAEYHLWNLALTDEDDVYLRGVEGDRITVINDFCGFNPWLDTWLRFNNVYRHYADRRYDGCLFVKIDDDVVFVETERFGALIEAVAANRDSVVSAKVINNGACTETEDGWWQGFLALDLPLLEVFTSRQYAEMCHAYALDHWPAMIAQPLVLRPTRNWLSINPVGFDWHMLRRIVADLDGPAPQLIAGRPFPAPSTLGDEPAFNTRPRQILQGLLAAHLYYGPQAKTMPDDVVDGLRRRYAEVGRQYLESTA